MAARGTDGRVFPWGNEWDDTRGNRGHRDPQQKNWVGDEADGYAGTAPVGSFPRGASPYGAEDMAGNVWEWVKDCYGRNYYEESPMESPQGPSSGRDRVIRGGCWFNNSGGLRTASRHSIDPAKRSDGIGLRCAQDQ